MFENRSINKETDDSELFRLIQQGNRDAFTLVYEKFHKMLYILAFRYLKDKAMAEDAVQHVFIKLWEYHSDILITISLKNYLYTMTRNYLLNQIRNNNSAIAHNYQLTQCTEQYEDNLLKTIEDKELMFAFYEALELLPQQKKIICMLKLEGELSNQEIADKVQLSINTVKTHHSQTIKLLRSYLTKMLIIVSLYHPFTLH